jgi:hypothetical protein
MRLTVSRILLLVCALFAVIPATAGAATAPKVTKVTPLKLKIGDKLTIRGKGFLAGKNRNTVVFKASGARAVFVKAQSATTTKLVVKVPAKLAPFLKVSAGQATATRFQLRVLARKLSPSYTPRGKSPVIAPALATAAEQKPVTKAPAAAAAVAAAPLANDVVATPAPAAAPAPDCDKDGTPDATDLDDDNDGLDDATERSIGTNVCNADTDGDTMEDGWEYQSAIDLNAIACPDTVGNAYPRPCAAVKPFPRKLNYPNPLYADSGTSDYDHDSVPTLFEYTAWKRHPGHSLSNMWYSDGLQSSVDSVPTDSCDGMTSDDVVLPGNLGLTVTWTVPTAYLQMRDLNNNGCLSDDERDEDGDLLTNYDEIRGRMSGGIWWTKEYEGEGIYPDADLDNGGWIDGTDWLDADTDGDGIVDGLDDQDNDDLLNIEELERGHDVSNADHNGLWVNPFNPCLPWRQAAGCDIHPPFDATWPPFADVATKWPMYRAFDGNAVYNDAVNPVPPAHLIPMPGTP